jgi:hypothetical protein
MLMKTPDGRPRIPRVAEKSMIANAIGSEETQWLGTYRLEITLSVSPDTPFQ